MKVTVTDLVIKAMLLVLWPFVLFTHVRGLVLWFWLLGFTPILMMRRWASVASIYGPAQLITTCPAYSACHPIQGPEGSMLPS